jgi:hypothetical protein
MGGFALDRTQPCSRLHGDACSRFDVRGTKATPFLSRKGSRPKGRGEPGGRAVELAPIGKLSPH